MTNPELNGWILPLSDEENYSKKRFAEEANKRGVKLANIIPERVDVIVTRNDRKSILVDGQTVSLPDFVLTRLGSGLGYHELAVMRHLERLNVQVINSSASVEIVSDKMYSMQVLAQHNLPVPKTMLVKFPVTTDLVEKHIGFPLVMKVLSGSLGKGVHLVNDKKGFTDLMELVEETGGKKHSIILQEFIAPSYGKDLRVIVVGGKVIGCMMRTAQDGNFKANFSRGGKTKPVKPSTLIEMLSIEATRVLGLDISGVDLLFDGSGGFKICEVNSSPGFEGFEAAHEDVDVAQKVFDYVALRVGNSQNKQS